MFASSSLGFFAGSSGIVTPLGTYLFDDIGSPGTYNASISGRFNADGSISRIEHGVTTAAGNWCSPNIAGVGASYWIRATLGSGVAPTTGTLGVWLSMAVDNAWGLTALNAFKRSNLLIEIAADAAGSSIVTSGNLDLYVESLP